MAAPTTSMRPVVVETEANNSIGDEEVKSDDDPLNYNTWRKILSRPFTKGKMRALARELLSGLTVSLAQVPEAVAFAFTAGVDPIIGLQAAWIVGLVTALFGGAPGMISGATGALAVVLPNFVRDNGVGYLFIAVFLMGILQVIFGLVGGGRLVKLIGAPVMIGFANGLAIVIGIAQLHSFKQTPRYCPVPCDSSSYDWNACVDTQPTNGTSYKCDEYVTGMVALFQAIEVLLTMIVIILLPRCTKSFPSSLAGIIVGSAFEWAVVRQVGYETNTVGDLASVQGSFPVPIWLDDQYKSLVPSLGVAETYSTCLPLSATLAVIGLVESLMTMQLVSQITNRKPSPKAESLAQGAANIICGIFGGMGGCAMIGQSLVNVTSGGITRISSAFAAIFLLLILLVAYPLINLIPVASLAGVMFMVVYFTFEWHSLPIIAASCLPEKLRQHPRLKWIIKVKRTDVFIIVLVTVIAVFANLAYAVGAGVVFAALVFAWDQEKLLYTELVDPGLGSQDKEKTVKILLDQDDNDGEGGSGDETSVSDDTRASGVAETQELEMQDLETQKLVADEEKGQEIQTIRSNLELPENTNLENVKVYRIKGPVFFASGQTFVSLFNPRNDPDVVVLYLDETVLSDYTALVAVNTVAKKYQAMDKKLYLRKVHPLSMKTIKKAHHLVYSYDKSRSDQVNEDELLCMELAPRWQQEEIPVYAGVDDGIASSNDHREGLNDIDDTKLAQI